MAHSGTLIYMRNVPGKPKMRALTRPLPCTMPDGSVDEIPCDFKWDGASTPWGLRWTFPRHNHPVASAKHDYRCGKAKNAAERAWADKEFKADVSTTSWKITAWWGYAGVRVGAYFGVGSNF
jgi:hypothetical protein